jgi:hypothetical protein
LRNVQVSKIIRQLQAQQLEKAELSAGRVLEELRGVSFIDARSFWTKSGRLKRPQELTEEQGSVLASFEALIKNAKAGDRKTDLIHKLKLWDKIRALETLAKHTAYYHGARTHLSLEKDAPTPRRVQAPTEGRVVAFVEVGGLHHRYERRAA